VVGSVFKLQNDGEDAKKKMANEEELKIARDIFKLCTGIIIAFFLAIAFVTLFGPISDL